MKLLKTIKYKLLIVKCNDYLFMCIVLFFLLLQGSCSIFSPYKSGFQCPLTDEGKCVSVSDAYTGSKEGDSNGADKKVSNKQQGGDTYESILFQQYRDIMKEPAIPMVIPAKVLRIYIFPYTSKDNEFFMGRYVYFLAGQHKWFLQNDKTSDFNFGD